MLVKEFKQLAVGAVNEGDTHFDHGSCAIGCNLAGLAHGLCARIQRCAVNAVNVIGLERKVKKTLVNTLARFAASENFDTAAVAHIHHNGSALALAPADALGESDSFIKFNALVQIACVKRNVMESLYLCFLPLF